MKTLLFVSQPFSYTKRGKTLQNLHCFQKLHLIKVSVMLSDHSLSYYFFSKTEHITIF